MVGNQNKSEFSVKTESKGAAVSHSHFDLSHHNYITPQYGRITPFLRMEGVAGDKINVRNSHKVRSYTLKSPLMSDVYMQKDYFAVPMEAILPLNWNKIFTNPVIGDDVDASKCNSLFTPSKIDFGAMLSSVQTYFEDGAGWQPHLGINTLLFLEKFLSKGSLFSLLGMNLWSCIQVGSYWEFKDTSINFTAAIQRNSDFDDIEDIILRWLRAYVMHGYSRIISVKYIELDSSQSSGFVEKTTQFEPTDNTDTSYFEDFIDFAREHWLTSFSVEENPTAAVQATNLVLAYNAITTPINVSPIFAYQICCAHYFTNDRIDYIYSAELYRQMMTGFCPNYSTKYFDYNGVPTFYDACSAYWIDVHCSAIASYSGTVDFYKSWYYLNNAFGFNNSLRYSDYFTGARLTPLAVGNTDISVNSNLVSVIDVSRNIQIQRFLNLVNKTGRKFEEYVSKLFGTYVKPDFHNPSYLSKVRDKVITYETENTADAQQTKPVSVTSAFNGTSSNFSFEFNCDRPTIILGLLSFDIPRVYSRIIERENLHVDRFDYFNPFMQFIGDQEIFKCELNPNAGTDPWAYQSRYAEYKTRLPICSGGFSKQNVLPSWQFVADLNMNSDISSNIDASYIRSRRSELDKFFLNLVGETPATRFHFIVDMHNNIGANRPMVANPNIL